MFTRYRRLFLCLIFLLPISVVKAETTSRSAEIVSYNTFGEGVMVSKVKMAPISGTVSNIFFYNRADLPWEGNIWYEYDWEIRGAHPYGGWSQIRVREENGGTLYDAPINVTMLENIGQKFLHYVLIRKDNVYVYDVRESFDIETYDYTLAGEHGGNSTSILDGGARVYFTGDDVGHIPADKGLDFSLGITSFDNSWAGFLPGEAYSGDYAVDFARFYEFDSQGELNTTPQWQDEFNNGQLDYSKWFPATWTFHDTQFTTDNIRFENGYIIFRANRGQEDGDINQTNIAANGTASQSTTIDNGLASRAIDGVVDGSFENNSVTLTDDESNSWWELELAQTSDLDQIVIYNRTDCCESLADFTVTVLDEEDNAVWTQFYSEINSSIVTINLDAEGKKVRINLNGVLSLAEVEVFGTSPKVLDNVALTGTASQSSTGYDGVASRAIDGDTNGFWSGASVTHTNTRDDSWWQVELVQEHTIEQIVLFNRTDSCCSSRLANFTVSVEDADGNETWSEEYEGLTESSLTIDLLVTGKVVKVTLDGALSLAEVQVFAEAQDEFVAEPEPVELDNELSIDTAFDGGNSIEGFIALNAIDNDTGFDSRWSASNNSSAVNLTIQLEAVSAVSSMDIAWGLGDQAIYEFEVYARPGTSGAWTKVFDSFSSGDTNALESFDLIDIDAQQVRIKSFGNDSGDDITNIKEVKIYGPSE